MTKPTSPRPLSIKVIIILYVLGGLWQAVVTLGEIPQLVAAFSIIALSWLIYGVLITCLALYLAFGLWTLRNLARKIAIGFELFTMLTSVFLLVGSLWFAGLLEASVIGRTVWLLGLVALLLMKNVLTIFFLVTRKWAFVKAPTAGQG